MFHIIFKVCMLQALCRIKESPNEKKTTEQDHSSDALITGSDEQLCVTRWINFTTIVPYY